ncbi:16S rRNA (cytosine(1402)-N(4))-methyltransferase RsmH [Flexithrix dorotheae]|uniref:16S rRNA (cytosine(1402)-N(4))-methyltransferase RsmH n=1 Tax=Flexithrix dorotheae TaxID=70993 RepID=UPI00036E9F19|nr:16S rRNA (cytosine(1402)-N(4))-methyltransferase RsmH [Flexithrix dorotheae]
MATYHVPVLLDECIEGLEINPDGVYVDLTFGGGGHSKAILTKLNKGKLIAFDQDLEAVKNAEGLDKNKFTLVESNFRHLKRYLKILGFPKVSGILADLGVSSHQFDKGERGFSIRGVGELDMRMDQTKGITAKEIVNEYSEDELVVVFSSYGEVKNFRKLASGIVNSRAGKSIETTKDLLDIVEKYSQKGKEFKYFAQVFQALRIEVNDEMGALKEMLLQTEEVLESGGRLVVMSYHSLEDRLVKNYLKTGNLEGKVEKDFYGNLIRPFTPVSNKPIKASDEEIARNNRARSVRLRIATKNDLK